MHVVSHISRYSVIDHSKCLTRHTTQFLYPKMGYLGYTFQVGHIIPPHPLSPRFSIVSDNIFDLDYSSRSYIHFHGPIVQLSIVLNNVIVALLSTLLYYIVVGCVCASVCSSGVSVCLCVQKKNFKKKNQKKKNS